MSAALAHRGQHRDRHGELQCTGEVHHQHSQRLCDVARDEIGQHRAAERIWHKAVGKAGRLVLGGGFELFGLLYHLHDAVIAAAAGCFLHADDALALFGDSARIHIAARPLRYRHGFAGHRSLIDHRLALNDLAVERNHAAGAVLDAAFGEAEMIRHQTLQPFKGPEKDAFQLAAHFLRDVGVIHAIWLAFPGGQNQLAR